MDSINDYVLIERIGAGTYGTGFLSQDVKQEDLVCVKVYNLSIDESPESKRAAQEWHNEKSFDEMKLEHPHLLRGLGGGSAHLYKKGKDDALKFYMVSELAMNGELLGLI